MWNTIVFESDTYVRGIIILLLASSVDYYLLWYWISGIIPHLASAVDWFEGTRYCIRIALCKYTIVISEWLIKGNF